MDPVSPLVGLSASFSQLETVVADVQAKKATLDSANAAAAAASDAYEGALATAHTLQQSIQESLAVLVPPSNVRVSG